MRTYEKDHLSEQPIGTEEERAAARKRVEAKRSFMSNLVAYVVVNAFLVLMWSVTGAGYFWPGWVLGAWGAGLVLHAWDTFARVPVTEADIDAEVRRQHR
jgi:uncharacterized membrane protein YecN with MAPEG domain